MVTTQTIDLTGVARDLGLDPRQVEAVVDLLGAGNTVPFITRYRKDQTGGLDEEQIRQVQARVTQLRLLAERKQTILRSIEGQGKLTPELAAAIEEANTTKRLEDLYLPYKPKKQTLATLARQRGLELLAQEIIGAAPECADLDARARDFVNPDRGVPTAADALLGAGHILAEQFSERAALRQRLREILTRTGQLVSTRIEPDEKDKAKEKKEEKPKDAETDAAASPPQESKRHQEVAAETTPPHDASPTAEQNEASAAVETTSRDATPLSDDASTGATPVEVAEVRDPQTQAANEAPPGESPPAELTSEASTSEPPAGEPAGIGAPEQDAAVPSAAVKHEKPPAPAKAQRRKAEKKKEEKDKKEEQQYRDYFDYREPLGKIPPHRILAINRGEKAKVLRVRLEADMAALERAADEMLVPADHPHADFLRGCGRDALTRLVLPSLEREIRRELTEKADAHAVEVFARNLRHLLLQPPVHGRRLLAIDPGFRSGCKVAALDEFGNLLEHGVVHLVGKAERRAEAPVKLVEMITKHDLSDVAIGNGTACRQTEELIAGLIANELKDRNMAYVIVNEAGASVYSASRIGREEFPNYDATLRGTISIGRRLQDPLSELVKIDPANIGVGLYQHDVKAKHLRESLEAVVESCVNYVGVDLNTASPSLLQAVSGLNQLTARRLYDYRVANGPFKSREQLKSVPSFGEATFTQAAGFLKITGGENPLDATWIHPESYSVATQVLEKLGASVRDLEDKSAQARLAERAAQVDPQALAAELGVGDLTLRDILNDLVRPGRDPREDLPPPVFKRGVLKLEDLSIGMELSGSVLNVVDFGAFVDIGLSDSGLVHISQMANKYVASPHEVVAVGDIVKVWVLGVDKERRRVSLTMIPPGTERTSESRRGDRQGGEAKEGGGRRGAQRRRSRKPQRPATVGAGSGGNARPSGSRPPARPKRKPPAPVMLTKEKKEGKEPLRTFGELKKLFELKSQEKGAE